MANSIYVTMSKSWLEKNKAKAAKDYFERFPGEEAKERKDGLLFELEPERAELDDGEIHWDLMGPEGEPFVSVTYVMSTEDQVKLAELLIKRLNKAKSAIEAALD
jgi:hypothetical protein